MRTYLSLTVASGLQSDSGPDSELILNSSVDPRPDREPNATKPLGMFLAPPVFMATASAHAQPWLIVSGAAISGTGTRGDIASMRRCNIPITPAFGEVTRAATERIIDSVLGQLGIRVLHVDNMNHKLLSVHQVCDGGSQHHHHQVGVFTNEGCRFFPAKDCRYALKLLSSPRRSICLLSCG